MHSYDRQAEILQLLAQSGYASVHKLAQTLHVSEPTMRRDLRDMEASGRIRRTHGGAALLERGTHIPLSLRSEIDSEKKRLIAQKAAVMIPDGATVFFDASSTVRHIIHFLRERQKFTAVCNSPAMCGELTKLHIPTYCVGGRINELDDAVRGPHAETFLRNMHFDLAFFSCMALSETGVLYGRLEEGTSFLRVLIGQSTRSVFLCTSSRINICGIHKVCELGDIDIVLSDQPLPENLQRMIGSKKRTAGT